MGKKAGANGEGGIRRRKDGRYEGRYTIQTATGAKRMAVYGTSHEDTRKKLAAAIAERGRGLVFDTNKQAIAICEWAVKTDEPAKALTNWARKNCRGQVRPRPAKRVPRAANPFLGVTLKCRVVAQLGKSTRSYSQAHRWPHSGAGGYPYLLPRRIHVR